jgi:hypothetical protein
MHGSAQSPRRWFRYSLRTMFVVVTVFALWLGWELKFIRDRKAMQTWLKENGGSVMSVDEGYQIAGHWGGGFVPPSIPWWRRMLGDEPIPSVGLPREEPKYKDRCSLLFPEAEIYDYDEH